jgi:hypothetical protein
VLKHDPNIDRLIVLDRNVIPVHEWGLFFEHEKKRYTRWINFIQSAEIELLKTPDQASFYWPAELRRALCDHNYVEFMHRVAEVPYKLEQRFFPTNEERKWARAERAKMPGRVVVLANAGSTAPKWWPYAPAFAQLLAELGIHVVVVGDMKGLEYPKHELVHVIGMGTWAIRQSLTFAQLRERDRGPGDGPPQLRALEAVPKVVMLSHSSAKNLTRDWVNVRARRRGAVLSVPPDPLHARELPAGRGHQGRQVPGGHQRRSGDGCAATWAWSPPRTLRSSPRGARKSRRPPEWPSPPPSSGARGGDRRRRAQGHLRGKTVKYRSMDELLKAYEFVRGS